MTKAEKNMNGNEPAIADVMSAVRGLTEAVQSGFAKVHERINDEFAQVSDRFEKVERGVRALQTGQNNLTERVGDIQRRVVNLEHRVEDVRESLADILRAEEKDAEATINHEFRISYLEQLSGIKSVPAEHLANLE
ncbi:MAG: hypothetical protein ACYC4I_03600 [Minisyncoccota bacterium]